ncbi:MAG: glutamate-5-semialdehyde dehydrogenase [Spirochaetaceae bacterium]|jgi:glutamate-5-semialdehyde dehydrogenase|nr:glutamate-5-semialdehyde dehydrogenase [Spirochaetaceae bacterium]
MNLTPVFISLKEAQKKLALQNRQEKDAALEAAAEAIDRNRGAILAANAGDLQRARSGGMTEALADRLTLTGRRIDLILSGLRTIIGLEDPIGRIRGGWKTPNGLVIEQITVPLGVAAIIYESRPNVSVDAFSLAYKAGCGILLRGSSAALESNRALTAAIKEGLEAAGGIGGAVALADSGSRDEIDEILHARGYVDVVLPRGGRDLIRRVVEHAGVPVIETGEGNCHIYADETAEVETAAAIIENAKLQKPGACNAVETLLVHRKALPALMPVLAKRLLGKAELRCDPSAKAAVIGARTPALRGAAEGAALPHAAVKDAVEEDWDTEYLDYILAVKTVDSLDEAVDHINRHGTGHSEAILTNDHRAAEEFCRRVDAACVYVNASTRFTDGGEFGFGAELGISTQKFHARGPMGLEALTTIKYHIRGAGQIRKSS